MLSAKPVTGQTDSGEQGVLYGSFKLGNDEAMPLLRFPRKMPWPGRPDGLGVEAQDAAYERLREPSKLGQFIRFDLELRHDWRQ